MSFTGLLQPIICHYSPWNVLLAPFAGNRYTRTMNDAHILSGNLLLSHAGCFISKGIASAAPRNPDPA
jgi:hypothetical protein